MKDNHTKVYLCCYSSGQYDDWRQVIVFATTSRNKAIKWKQKFNRILNKWKRHYSQYENDITYGFTWIKDEYSEKYYDRWYSLKRINKAFIEEINLR